MRCLLVTPYFPPALGGACRLLGALAESLCDDGHIVEVLTFATPHDPPFREHDGASRATIHRVVATGQNGRSIVAMGARLAVLLSRRPGYDVIFCGVAYSSGALAYLATRLARVPYLVYSHGEDAIFIEASRWKLGLMNRAFARAARLFVNSGYTRDVFRRIGVPVERVEVLYPSIDAARYGRVTDAQAGAFLARLGLAGAPVILTVARLQPRKGHDVVVQALPEIVARVPDVHYLVIGKGDASGLHRLAAELGVSRHLTIVPSLDDADLALAYRACRLLVMVSRADPSGEVEGFGMVYLEAGAAGRPSVSGNEGGVPEAVVDGVTGLNVDPRSAAQTARAVIQLLEDPALRERMGLAARERVLRRFDDRAFLAVLKSACVEAARAL